MTQGEEVEETYGVTSLRHQGVKLLLVEPVEAQSRRHWTKRAKF